LGKDERFAETERLARTLLAAVGAVIPVLPVPLVATALVQRHDRGESPLSELDLKARVHRLIAELEAAGAHVYIPRRDQDYAVMAGLRMLTLRHLAEERDGLYAARPEELLVLRYYANSIAHLLPAQARAVAGG
ncbi:MAG TPA: glycerol-3-phosphate acyltransferase, partial [Thermoanaerobaculia bacterium]|nr:glycerol-3-phosphate acyltransferase [Thermoanaerobaculia bacterium]